MKSGTKSVWQRRKKGSSAEVWGWGGREEK